MILVACCPPGNVSNILTHRAGGNVALSVSMTAISNALAIVLMPLNFAFWGGMHPTAAPLLRSIALDPLEMAAHIVAIIGLPFALGILCAEKLPRFTQRVTRPVRILSFLCLIGFIVGAVAGNWRYFFWTTWVWCCWPWCCTTRWLLAPATPAHGSVACRTTTGVR